MGINAEMGGSVEILMDLVDLNNKDKAFANLQCVEILMDLVDLNIRSSIIYKINYSRDPYGSRGSKFLFLAK